MHPLLKRQLKRLALSENTPPSNAVAWQEFLDRISRSYTEADQERYLVERSLTLSSREMLQLYEHQRQETETRLATERDRLQAVISSLGAGLCILDPKGCLLSMNPEAERLLGWKQTELLGQPLLQHIAPDSKLSSVDFLSTFQDGLDCSSSATCVPQILKSSDDQFLCRNHQILAVSYVLNPILDHETLIGAVLIFLDITDRKRAQLEAERSLSLLQATFNATDAGIVALDRHGKVCNFNQKFVEMWQIPEAMLYSPNPQSALTFVLRQLKYPPRFLNTVMQLSADPKTPTYDIVEFKDSRIFEVYSHPSKVGEKIVGRVWSFRDITERKRVEKSLKHRVEFEQLITNLSTYFISLSTEEIDHGIEQALQKISTFIGVDRGYIYLFPDDESLIKSFYEWKKDSNKTDLPEESTAALPQKNKLINILEDRLNPNSNEKLNPSEIPWIMQHLNQLKSIHLLADDLSEEAQSDLQYLQQFHSKDSLFEPPKKSLENLQYLSIIPLVCSKSVVGFLRFDALNSAFTWSSDSVALLKMVAEMFSNAIQRKRTEAVLRQTEAKYRSIFENAAEGICQTTPQGRYLSANPALARILGYASPSALIERITDINQQLYVKPNRRAEFIAAMQANPVVSGFESQVYRQDGSIIWISENARAVRDATGRIVCYEGTVEDITESKEASVALKQAKEAAVAASRAKSTFLANMSHELRTPLNAIIGYGEILAEEAEDSGYGDLVPDLERICNAGRNLLTLINDILDISKIEAGRMDLYLEALNISDLIESVISTAQPLVDRNGNTLEVECDSEIEMMIADVTKVQQILLNLLSNAAKFTTAGQIKLKVSSLLPEPQNLEYGESENSATSFIQFQVSDTGIGMSPEQLDILFQPFTQGDASTTRRYGGTGLGLTISQRFCQMMGGSITVESQLDRGSTFTVILPTEVKNQTGELIEEEDNWKPPISSLITQHSITPVTATANLDHTILVIDDDLIAQDLIVRSLTAEGIKIETASSGQEGLRKAKELHPDAITLDIMMPSMDGWTVLSALKADLELADIPVIVLSFVSNKTRGFALGASDYLIKPVDGKRLANLVRKYQHQHHDDDSNPINHILIVEDDLSARQMLRELLERDGWRVWEAEDGSTALKQLTQHTPSLILLDLVLPQISGFELIDLLRNTPDWARIPIIVTTAMDLTSRESSQLQGCVEQILQKGSYNCEDLLRDIRGLVNASLRTSSLVSPSRNTELSTLKSDHG
ncbi:response regulator [Limnoraphis robusta]|uniref:histidine kinase n=1 Tax=Limnoraphis robusta CCNP1315 TaxID=3110306 RepID=A0ABU5U5P0_9CYAN|nr:response regulator [Limnoraphis robusta]MEA5522521.1 response regulator [Limnoraphis robusta CCNP1315]MEA5548264.1 response regulator [Limnoraphis robusta CCNP1324]